MTRREVRQRDAVGVRRLIGLIGLPLPKWWHQSVLRCFAAAAMPDQGGFAIVAISTREQKNGKYPCDDDEY